MLVGSHMGSNKHLHQDLLNLHSTMDGFVLLSPRCTRARSKPNLSVSEKKYKEALHAVFVADPPIMDLKNKLGPMLVKHPKQVTPGHLVSLEQLWYQLISSGCKQLVLQSIKISSALHALVCENSLLLPADTPPIKIPCIIADVKAHIMDCATLMRAIKNEGMPGSSKTNSDMASALKHKMVGLHLQVLSPIIALMEHSDAVMNEPAMPCPLSPPWPSSIPQLPPSAFSALGVCTPTTSAKVARQITPQKLLQPPAAPALLPPAAPAGNSDTIQDRLRQVIARAEGCDITMGEGKAEGKGEGKGCDITMGECKGTRSIEHDDVQSANDGGDVSNVDDDCKLDPDIVVDECGYPTIFGSILMSQVAVGEDGYPTIFGSILKGDGEFEGVNVDSMDCDEGLPSIRPINPNVRARKLEVNKVAKAKLEQDVANGVAPSTKKRLKSKQAVKKKTLKATMIQQWHPSDPHPKAKSKAKDAQPKAKSKAKAKTKPSPKPKATRKSKAEVEEEAQPKAKAKEDDPKADSDAQALQVGTACRKGITNADALILSAHGSCNAATGRFDIQGKCTLPDGSCKNIGILGFCEKDFFGVQVWNTLLAKINDAKGKHTKGEIVMLRDKLIAGYKAGHPCIDAD